VGIFLFTASSKTVVCDTLGSGDTQEVKRLEREIKLTPPLAMSLHQEIMELCFLSLCAPSAY
jgi:hypothetical protein